MASVYVGIEHSTIASELTAGDALARFINELAYQIGEEKPSASWQKEFREELDEDAVRLLHDLVHASRDPDAA
jgi:hypothetical protein